MAIGKEELIHERSPEHLWMGQQDWNKTIKDKGEEVKKKGMNVERSTFGTKKSRQRFNLNVKSHLSSSRLQSRQLLTTVRQEVLHNTSSLFLLSRKKADGNSRC